MTFRNALEEEEEEELDLFQGVCVKFFNEATVDQLANLPRCSNAVAEALLSLRPFKSFDDLVRRFDYSGTKVQ